MNELDNQPLGEHDTARLRPLSFQDIIKQKKEKKVTVSQDFVFLRIFA